MARDKAKDDKFFNCQEEHERLYVAGLYVQSGRVAEFLKEKCNSGAISYSTHKEVYEMIKKELGLSIPN